MKLSELKQMVAEEYSRYLAEQDQPPMPPMPPAGGDPAISVEPDDIHVGEDPSQMLRNIYDMLKAHFEAEDAAPAPGVAGGPAVPPMPDTPDDDMADANVDDGDDDEEDTVDEAYGETTGGNAARTSGNYGGAYGATGEDRGDKHLHEGFKSRLKKLANIKG